jgi:4-hydroxy-tetrahydrodipicolinate synthase
MSQEKARIRGIVVPMMTPLTAEAEIDEEGVARLADYLIGGGVHALFALGSSGEFVSLAGRKKERLIAAVVRAAAGRVPVCIGISSNCIEQASEEAARAASLGASAVAALTPFYFRSSQDEMVDFFAAIADRSSVPLIAYNMPFRTNNNLEPATVERLAAHPNIAGVKDTVSDMARTLDILARLAGRPGFAYLHGNEMLTVPSLLFGAAGAVPSVANFAPRVFVDAFDAARARDLDKLKSLHARIPRRMRVWGLLESRRQESPPRRRPAGACRVRLRGEVQESTTLRLQAVKTVLEIGGICRNYMAQMDRRPDATALARVEAFVREEGLFAAH